MSGGEPSPFVVGAARTEMRDDGGVAASSFSRCRAFVCAHALDPPFLASILNVSRRATFVPDVVELLGHREIETPSRAGAALSLALGRSSLVRWLEETTRRGPFGSVDGRVVQTRPAEMHQLLWHDDLNVPERRLAITIDLSEERYEGGMFELRKAGTGEVLLRHRHAGPGAALVFDVSPGLEHRVLPLASGGPRRVYAGWFLAGEPG